MPTTDDFPERPGRRGFVRGRDCWARADLPAGTRTLSIPPHGARLVRSA